MIGTWTWEIFALDEDLALGVTYHQALYSVLRQLKEISLPFFDSYNTKLNGGVMAPTPQKRGDFPPLDLTDITLALDPSHPVTTLLAPHLGPSRASASTLASQATQSSSSRWPQSWRRAWTSRLWRACLL